MPLLVTPQWMRLVPAPVFVTVAPASLISAEPAFDGNDAAPLSVSDAPDLLSQIEPATAWS